MVEKLSFSRSRQLKNLEKEMKKSSSFQQWRELASRYDAISGADEWKERDDSSLYDARQVRARYTLIKDLAENGTPQEVLFALNEGIHGNMGGMGKAALYKRAKNGTKTLITNYVEGIKDALRYIAAAPESEVHFDEKLDFFRRASHCFGRSALSLSGGSGLIYFHHGVVDTLLEENLLPNILSGASAGAWMCAQIGTRTDEELKSYLINKRYDFNVAVGLKEVVGLARGKNRDGVAGARDDVIDEFVGDFTFQEAFEHTGRYINISIAPAEKHQTSRLMNAITSPNVTIRSAAKASSSVPGMIEPAMLEAKDSQGRIKPYLGSRRWVDGSFSEDLPFKRLSRLFGVNHFIVSMINPFAVPFLKTDPKVMKDGLKKSLSSLLLESMKESIKTLRHWAAPVYRNRADAILGTLYQVMDQQYVGDINIILDPSYVHPGNILFNYKDDSQIQELIEAGMRSTWPKVDMIRNATSISHTIDEILNELEADSLEKVHGQHKRHMVL